MKFLCVPGGVTVSSLSSLHSSCHIIHHLPIWDSVFILLLQSRNSSSSTAYFNVNKPHCDLEQASSLSRVSSHHTSLLMAKSTLTQLSLQLLVSLPLPKPHAPVANYSGGHGFATFINSVAELPPSSTAYLPLLPSFPLRTRVLRSAAAGQRLQEGGAGAMPQLQHNRDGAPVKTAAFVTKMPTYQPIYPGNYFSVALLLRILPGSCHQLVTVRD